MSIVPRTLAIAATLPGWMEAQRHRAGPLLAAADDLQRWLGPNPFPEGRDGIRRLGELVDAFVFDEKYADASDDRFVEGAGAMLALLLLSHVGVGGHRERGTAHAIAIGSYGFFDPFAAIDASLEAPRPSAELARRIAEAEAEAAGEGPFARVHAALDESLARSRTGRVARDRFELHATLDDGTELELARFAPFANDAKALAASLDKLVSWLESGPTEARPVDWAEVEARVVPRLVSRRFADELRTTRSISIAFAPVAHDLGASLVLAYDGRLRFLRHDEEASIAASGRDARATAMRRLDDSTNAMRWRAETLGGCPCAIGTRGDGLAATSILAQPVRESLAVKLGHGYVIGVPHRDRLVATHDADDFCALAAHVADEFHRAPHGVSPHLFRVTAEGLELIP